MNIFVVDDDPAVAAEMLCDKHVNSQLRESAQMLCSAFEPGTAPMKRTHFNHPCTKWARESYQNWWWLFQHGYALGMEFAFRYFNDHKCAHHIDWCRRNRHKLEIPNLGLTAFAQAMPDEYKIPGDAVGAYRAYYLGEKRKFAKWTKRRPPFWWRVSEEGSLKTA